MKVKPKKNVEIPPDVRSFTERVLSTPLENLADALNGFTWRYDKGDFHHWIPLFNHFDTFFEKYIRSRSDLMLKCGPSDVDPPFPTLNTVAVLKVTTRILENCTNKHLYQSYEHLTELLAAEESEVVTGALQALVAFLRKGHHSGVRFHGYPLLNSRLFDLCKGWGGKEQGLDMAACVHEDMTKVEDYIKDVSSLQFGFYNEKQESDESVVGYRVIQLENLHYKKRSDHQTLQYLVECYSVPQELRFRLLTRIRIASNFGSLEGRRALVKLRLLAFCVLIQSNPSHEEMLSFFNSEPEFMTELVELIQTDHGIPLELRTLAIRAMTVQLVDRSRHSAVINAVGMGGQNGILANLLQDSIECICPSDRPSSSSSSSNRKTKYNAQFVEALLVLVATLISSASGNVNLNEAGFIPALLPLIRDRTQSHVTLVCTAVKILEGFMDYSSTASALFRGMGGLNVMVSRLEAEVNAPISEEAASSTSTSHGTKRKLTNDEPVKQQVSYLRRLLMKSLLRAIALASYAPTVGTASRLEDADARALYDCLRAIFGRAKEFGGALFAFAATVATDLIHNDPHCFGSLDEAGVPDAFLDAICKGVLPSSEAVCSIPNTLVAFCLNTVGLQKVRDRRALHCLITIFTSKHYIKALSGDTASILGAGVDELFRHVPVLRDDGIEHVVIQMLKALCALGGDADIAEDMTATASDSEASAANVPAEVLESVKQTGIDASLPECISHAAKMLESLLSNSDTSRRFAQNGGVELLLKFYTLPKMPSAFVSSSQSNPLLSIFRSLTHNNCQALHQHVPQILARQLERSVVSAEKLGDACVLTLESDVREVYIRQIASTSGLTSVAGTIARTSMPMLTEMCKGDKSLISALGIMERKILHQLSLADGWKERRDLMKKEAEDAASEVATAMMPGVEDSEAEKTDTEVDAMDIEQDYVLPELAATLPPVVEMQPLNGAKLAPKKAPDELAYDALQHFVVTVRTLYTSVAKANHTPARRRDESFARPTMQMKAAALSLALVLKQNLDYEIADLHPSTQCYVKHTTRLIEEVQMVLFDGRRHCCHTLILNYFVAVKGFASLVERFEQLMRVLWTRIELESMQPGPSSSEPAVDSDLKSAVEGLVLSFLTLFTQLTNPRLLCQSAQTASLLVAALPSVTEAEDEPDDSNSTQSEAFVKNMQESVLHAVLPVWSHPLFAKTTPTITGNIISILNSCLDGSGTLSAAFNAIRSDGRFGLNRSAPDQNMVQQIIDMGFSRPRALQALRRIGQNSVEMALDWLVNHPDEPLPEEREAAPNAQEQELAEAMAASLNELKEPEQASTSSAPPSESIRVLDLVKGAVSVVEKSPVSAFSVSSFIMTLCNRNEGADRKTVIEWFVSSLNETMACSSALTEITTKMNAIAHLLAIMMSESVPCRNLAVEVMMVPALMKTLDQWEERYNAPEEIPVWIEGLLLVLDFLSQTQHRREDDSSEDSSSHSSDSEMEEERQKTPLERILSKWSPAGAIQEEQRTHLVEFCIKLLKHLHSYGSVWSPHESSTHHHLTAADPADATQAVIQLLSSITRCHPTALKFLHKGGVDLLLTLPASCVLPRHESYILCILKHILEDDATLQSLMESEIKNVFSTQRRPMTQLPLYDWERMPLRTFLQKMSLMAYRSPTVFSKAVSALCTLADNNGNQVICLKKPKASGANKPTSGTSSAEKGSAESSKKNNKKAVLLSFVEVIDKLLEQVMCFNLAAKNPMAVDKDDKMDTSKSAMPTPMVTPSPSQRPQSIRTPPNQPNAHNSNAGEQQANETERALLTGPVSRKTLMDNRDVIMQIMVLDMLAEFCLMYSSTVGVLLKRDAELAQRDPPGLSETYSSLLKRILHEHLSWTSTPKGIKPTLPEEASKFLQAVCIRSSEGRRRILTEVVGVLSWATNSNSKHSKRAQADTPFISAPGAPSGAKIKAIVDLIGSLLTNGSNAKNVNQANNRNPPPVSGLTVELIRSMRQGGVVAALIKTLDSIDFDHPEAANAICSIIKPLEVVTRPIPVAPKKASATQTEPASTSEPRPEEESRLSQEGGLVVSSSPPAPPEHLSPDLMEEDLNEIENAAQLYYALENMDEMVEQTLDEAMQSNEDDAMEEDEGSSSESDSSSESHSFHEHGSHENHVVVDEESEEIENEHEELEASDEEGLEEEEDDDMEEGEEEDDASADMELDDDADWEEDAAIREYTEALDHIENVMRGAEEREDFLGTRIIADGGGDGAQPNLRSVLGNMFGNFVGTGDGAREDLRNAVRYRLQTRDRNMNANAPFTIQSIPPAQHRLLTRPSDRGTGNDDGVSAATIPDAFGRRFGQIPHGEGRWRQFAFQDIPMTIEHLRDPHASDFGFYVVAGDRQGGRQGGYGVAAIIDERGSVDGSHPSNRTAGANWMHAMQGQFEQHLTEALPRETPPPPQPTPEAQQAPAEMQTETQEQPQEPVQPPPVQPEPSERAPQTNPASEVPAASTETAPTQTAAPPPPAEDVAMVEEETAAAEEAQEEMSLESEDAMEEDEAAALNEPEVAVSEDAPQEAERATQAAETSTDAAVDAEAADQGAQDTSREDNALPEEIITRAQQAGIDPTFLQELPRPLQLEILAEHGVSTAQLTQSEDQEANAGNDGEAAEGGEEGAIDPEFLAALPPDIREEVIETQRAAERRRDVQRRLSEGQGDEVANMIASLPDDIREEVLLYSGPDILANLPPNLLAEGQRMRERHVRHIGRDADDPLSSSLFFRRLRQNAGLARDARTQGKKDRKEELEGPPAIDVNGLSSLVRLLKMNAPAIKTQLTKLFLNLCVREDSRRHITQLLIQRLREVDADAARDATLITRRVLDMLSYLARHNTSKVAGTLLEVQALSTPVTEESLGKMPMQHASNQPRALEVLLELLGQPLCFRSVSTLEQDLQLLETVFQSAMEQKKEAQQAAAATEAPTASSSRIKSDLESVQHLSTEQLSLLPAIIGRDGLSDRAYKSAATVVKLIVEAAPEHQVFLLSSLKSKIQEQALTAINTLQDIAQRGMNRSTTHALGGTGALVLRTLHCVESVIALKPSEEKADAADVLSGIANALEQMWSDLSPVIAEIESHIKKSDLCTATAAAPVRVLPLGASQTLPFIESFFVLRSVQNSLTAPDEPAEEEGEARAESPALISFAERHRVLLNAFLRQTPALLEGSFKALIQSPRLIDFDNKRLYFRSQVRPDERVHYGTLRINVRREHVFEDSFYQLRHRSADALRCKLSVQFTGEEGIDAGGVSREWYQVMAREIFNANLALFIAVPDGAATFQPNPNSVIQNDRGVNHLDFFKFVGRLVGKAVYDGQMIDAHFTRSFYKHMLNQPLTYQDLEAVDLDFYKQMKWILDNNITDILMGQTFAAEVDFFGRTEVVELKEGGSQIPITESNKGEYVNLMTQHKMTTAIREQIKAFQDGFWELVPKELVSIFNDHELELIISGLPEVDVADIKANTEYTGYTAASQVIQWFWSVVEEFDAENLALLLQFVTGTSKVPLDGFEHLQGISGPQKFQIHRSYASEDRLPSAHTCFNQLDLPEYKSREQLKDRLMLAIHEGREGFGFG